MRSIAHAFAAIIALNVAGCADESLSDGDTGVAASFSIFKDGMNVPCASIPEIQRVEVIVYATDGVTRRPGFPMPADCQSGQVFLYNLGEGSHELEFVAHGQALGADDAVLFRAKSPISVPSSTEINLSLRPEVAFLTIGWTFQNSDFDPCESEVAEIIVRLGASTGQSVNFDTSADCEETPLRVPVPLPLLNYTIIVEAYSIDNFQIYSATAQRVLERGENTLNMTLMPLGSVVYLDWQFEIGSMSIRACDDPRVSTASISVTIDPDVGDAATELIDCTADRPYGFKKDRYPLGRTLEIEVVAEGAARFVASKRISTTGDDLYVPILVLEAVGTSSLAFSVQTATCAAASFDGIGVVAAKVDDLTRIVAQELPADAMGVIFEDLEYGEYEVVVSLLDGDTPICTSRGHGVINSRETAWDPIAL